MKPALQQQSLFEKVLSKENLKRAWNQVRSNKGAPGIDGLETIEFPLWARQHWKQCEANLRSGRYQPSPVKRVEIDKPDGGKRQLGIPTVIDRVIQQAISQVLTPIFDPTFSVHSFGFRPNRSAHQAVKEVQRYIKQKRRIAVDVDLSKFFDRVNHDLLMSKLSQGVQDKSLLSLIRRYLRSGVMVQGNLQESKEGVPQGGPLSPLLSNIMLDSLDKELESRGHCFSRYADDFVILVKSLRAGERVLASITRYLERRLKLVVNTEKSQVVPAIESKFLGFGFRSGKIRVHSKTLRKFKEKVLELTNRNWGVSMNYQLRKLSHYLRGWINYFGIANMYQQSIDLDQWIRRRVRMCYWRQWRKPKTKIQNLLKRGVSLRLAIACGASGKGPWRSSKTFGLNLALSKEYLCQEGLYSLQNGWIKIHHQKG